ncbi:MAG: HAD family hydrolase [Eubacterium sp.]|jgi:Cof subfamily protein (haloacid dehalogenase superfamily)
MIKLIATDLDNTLFDSNGQIPEESVRLLKLAASRGTAAAVASGRCFPSARLAAATVGAATPVICYNGAQIRRADGGTLFTSCVPAAVVSGIVDFCRERGLYLQMYDNDEIVVEKLDRSRHDDPDLDNTTYREVGDFRRMKPFKTPKILIAAATETVPALQAELEERYNGKAYFAQSESYLIEIMAAGVDKGSALRELMRILSLKKEEVMALGDNTNDIPMLEAAGLSVAVANAVPSLKSVADYVCAGERSEGFNEAVRRFVLGE